jgi:hypothetical protein
VLASSPKRRRHPWRCVKLLGFEGFDAICCVVESKPPSFGKARAPLIPAVVRINVTEPYSVREWSTKFGCSTEQLRAAVAVVGNVAADVARYLAPAPDLDDGRRALQRAFGPDRSEP